MLNGRASILSARPLRVAESEDQSAETLGLYCSLLFSLSVAGRNVGARWGNRVCVRAPSSCHRHLAASITAGRGGGARASITSVRNQGVADAAGGPAAARLGRTSPRRPTPGLRPTSRKLIALATRWGTLARQCHGDAQETA
jgi:hypothetical protein